VMICTAAGREGINLQHARVLFNFDLPWNPMDLEQRIGRIHRYGQKHTAQVYNLVLSDTIEGKIFLLLDDKLKEIAKALGKVDEHGEVAEDLRSQILGQLSERLSYESLYAQAISDPELKRTRLELEQALSNASEARDVVYELFQDLEGFSLDDYQPFSDTSEGMDEIVRFVRAAAEESGQQFQSEANGRYCVSDLAGGGSLKFTTDRESSLNDENVELLGLDHPLVVQFMQQYRSLPEEQIGIRVRSPDERTGVISIWQVTSQRERGESRIHVLPIAIGTGGERVPAWERSVDQMFQATPTEVVTQPPVELLIASCDAMLHRELSHRKIISEQRGYETRLIGWIEVVGQDATWDDETIQASIEENERIASASSNKAVSESNLDELGLGSDVGSMRALSIRQPFAEAILRGLKTTEYRSQPTKIRGRFLIYASLGRYSHEEEQEMLEDLDMTDVDMDALPRGVIVGSVELHDSNEGDWHLRDPHKAEKLVEPKNRANPVWFYPF